MTKACWKTGPSLNSAAMLSANSLAIALWLLNIGGLRGQCRPMMIRTLSLAFGLALMASTATAACYADYKAKQDNPLRLHYGVVEVQGNCTAANAAAYLTERLAADGWQLLEVMGTFDETGLEQRRADAGDYYLRY